MGKKQEIWGKETQVSFRNSLVQEQYILPSFVNSLIDSSNEKRTYEAELYTELAKDMINNPELLSKHPNPEQYQKEMEELLLFGIYHKEELRTEFPGFHEDDSYKRKLAQMYNQNPQMVKSFFEENIEAGHGSKSGSLVGVIKDGLLSPKNLHESGSIISTGEKIYSFGEGSVSYNYVFFAPWSRLEILSQYALNGGMVSERFLPTVENISNYLKTNKVRADWVGNTMKKIYLDISSDEKINAAIANAKKVGNIQLADKILSEAISLHPNYGELIDDFKHRNIDRGAQIIDPQSWLEDFNEKQKMLDFFMKTEKTQEEQLIQKYIQEDFPVIYMIGKKDHYKDFISLDRNYPKQLALLSRCGVSIILVPKERIKEVEEIVNSLGNKQKIFAIEDYL